MPFIPAPVGTVRAVFKFTVQGQECLIVQYYDVGAVDASGAELFAMANDLFNIWAATLDGDQSDECSLTEVQCTNVHEEGGAQAVSIQAPNPGDAAVPAVANALAFVVSLGTGLAGRSNRGRFFIPGIRNDGIDTDSNYWEPTIMGTVQGDATQFLTDVNALTVVGATPTDMVIASYYSGTDPVTGAPIPRAEAVLNPVVAITARRRIGTQRRRRPRS